MTFTANTTGSTVRFGPDNLSSQFNRLVMEQVNITNQNESSGQACTLCGIYAGRISGQFNTSGWGGLIIKQCVAVTFESCSVSAANGLSVWLTDGQITSNDFQFDIYGSGSVPNTTTGMQIDTAAAQGNVFRRITMNDVYYGIQVKAGSNNVVEQIAWNSVPPANQLPSGSTGLNFAPSPWPS